MKWIEKVTDLDNDMLHKFEDLINNIESTWNLLTVKVLNINGKDCPKIAIGNSGYVDLQTTDHGYYDVAIVLAKRDLFHKLAENEIAFCKMDPTSRNTIIKKYNSLYTRGLNIICRTINTALADAYQSASE